jgi:hypothetical protein
MRELPARSRSRPRSPPWRRRPRPRSPRISNATSPGAPASAPPRSPSPPDTLVHYLRWLAKGSDTRPALKSATRTRRIARIHRILGFGETDRWRRRPAWSATRSRVCPGQTAAPETSGALAPGPRDDRWPDPTRGGDHQRAARVLWQRSSRPATSSQCSRMTSTFTRLPMLAFKGA